MQTHLKLLLFGSEKDLLCIYESFRRCTSDENTIKSVYLYSIPQYITRIHVHEIKLNRPNIDLPLNIQTL